MLVTSHLLAQGDDTPTGPAGSFGGSIETGGGSFDPYERNASRSVTDIVVPGAVIPFTYTRIWNSRGTWRDNWGWDCTDIEGTDLPPGHTDPNELFKGYMLSYPDGRVVKFLKPVMTPSAEIGHPGTYTSTGVLDKFVIDQDAAHGHLFLEDGSVLNFTVTAGAIGITDIVDPHG